MFRPWFAIVFIAGLVGIHAASAEGRLALVIGQSAYRSVPVLTNPVNDARAVSQALAEDGFVVMSASDLSENQMREKLGAFAGQIAEKGPDTIALVYYAGHGVQIDGENYLIPIDVEPKRESDIPIQAIRLNDLLNVLTSVPNRMRIVLLDACRNDPFPDVNKVAAHGLALVDTKMGVSGTFVSFSTSPGAEADDGNDGHSPYAAALLSAMKEKGLPIENAFKHVRVTVNKATGGRQTPWDSSSLTENFEFVASADDHAMTPRAALVKRSVDEWRAELQGKPVETANEIVVSDGTEESYEAFVGLYTQQPFSSQARQWLDRHRRMVAWNNAVITNTAAGFRAFLTQYPDSDLTPTALKLEQRLRNRPANAQAMAASSATKPSSSPAPVAPAGVTKIGAAPADASGTGPTCPCAPAKKTDAPPKRRAEAEPPKRVERHTVRRVPSSGASSSYGGGGYGRSGY